MGESIPASFLWGAAGSAFRIEGAWNQDGKGESLGGRFNDKPHTFRNGDAACIHHHLVPRDVQRKVLAQRSGILQSEASPPNAALYQVLIGIATGSDNAVFQNQTGNCPQDEFNIAAAGASPLKWVVQPGHFLPLRCG